MIIPTITPVKRQMHLTLEFDDNGLQVLLHIFARHSTNCKGDAVYRDEADKLYKVINKLDV